MFALYRAKACLAGALALGILSSACSGASTDQGAATQDQRELLPPTTRTPLVTGFGTAHPDIVGQGVLYALATGKVMVDGVPHDELVVAGYERPNADAFAQKLEVRLVLAPKSAHAPRAVLAKSLRFADESNSQDDTHLQRAIDDDVERFLAQVTERRALGGAIGTSSFGGTLHPTSGEASSGDCSAPGASANSCSTCSTALEILGDFAVLGTAVAAVVVCETASLTLASPGCAALGWGLGGAVAFDLWAWHETETSCVVKSPDGK